MYFIISYFITISFIWLIIFLYNEDCLSLRNTCILNSVGVLFFMMPFLIGLVTVILHITTFSLLDLLFFSNAIIICLLVLINIWNNADYLSYRAACFAEAMLMILVTFPFDVILIALLWSGLGLTFIDAVLVIGPIMIGSISSLCLLIRGFSCTPSDEIKKAKLYPPI